MTNKQVKILENKSKQIENSLMDLNKQLNERGSFLCRNDPLYQSILSKRDMEKVRLNDMSEFLQMMEKKTDERKKPGTSGTDKKKDKAGEIPKDKDK